MFSCLRARVVAARSRALGRSVQIASWARGAAAPRPRRARRLRRCTCPLPRARARSRAPGGALGAASRPRGPAAPRPVAMGGLSPAQCEKMVDHSRRRSPFVRFMLDKMEEFGCAVPKSFVSCETCGSSEVNGGFRPDEGVVLCTEHMHSQADVDAVLTHELVHAYDQCRAKNIDWCNCDHHACSEIRAANLSGDCWLSREVARGNLTLAKGHQECVKRRAALSVAMNPNCSAPGQAKAAVKRQFDQCFADTAPFDRVPS